MDEQYLPEIDRTEWERIAAGNDLYAYYDLLCQPLHEELYRRQDFSYLLQLTEGQQMLVCYDYVQNHVLQGGFIQLIQNGYVPMLVPLPQWLNAAGQEEMARVIDDALKAYVQNRHVLDRETTVEEFAFLYEQLPEFQPLDKKFEELHPGCMAGILQYATHHIHEFATIKG